MLVIFARNKSHNEGAKWTAGAITNMIKVGLSDFNMCILKENPKPVQVDQVCTRSQLPTKLVYVDVVVRGLLAFCGVICCKEDGSLAYRNNVQFFSDCKRLVELSSCSPTKAGTMFSSSPTVKGLSML
ncbi:uncharacterized protein LOC133803159 [Humulus lupulus]|uniref:uncharacterized protein LOC133803159 n=1 Tax=Humulus lupulus TaxID=3486 RepID=UPI002B4062F8|nr:uncharacterized protein LOC133803159 [Humulus lupulus]